MSMSRCALFLRWAKMSKLRWALFICRWALFTYEMSTCRQCGCEDQLIFIFWLFLTIFNLPLFKWILLKLFNIVRPSNFYFRYFAICHLTLSSPGTHYTLFCGSWHTFGTFLGWRMWKTLLRAQKCISSNCIGLVKNKAIMLTYLPKCINEKRIGYYTFVALFGKKGYNQKWNLTYTILKHFFGLIS